MMKTLFVLRPKKMMAKEESPSLFFNSSLFRELKGLAYLGENATGA